MVVVSDDHLPTPPGSTVAPVLALLDVAAELDVILWLDGGWGVDALLGRQTRSHDDIDIVVEERSVAQLAGRLTDAGYAEVRPNEARAWNFVLGHPSGQLIDVHVIVLDRDGNGVYGPAENGDQYSAAALAGTGAVAGRPVRCMSPESMVAFHTGYPVDDKDWADVSKLCEEFGLAVPGDFDRWTADQ